jgi:DNA-binding NtrC family response regulator
MKGPLKIVLVDDDRDDHLIFAKALKEVAVETELTCLTNGEKLMGYLSKHIHDLPDAIFLDLNMPRKNGSECLVEIKRNKNLKNIPVVIYSTDFHTDILDILYKYGAYYCIRKSANKSQALDSVRRVLKSLAEHAGAQPPREKFAIGFVET